MTTLIFQRQSHVFSRKFIYNEKLFGASLPVMVYLGAISHQEDDLPHLGHVFRDDPLLVKGVKMAWIYLFIAGLLEVCWAYFMKLSEGFTKTGPTIWTLVFMMASFALLSISMRTLPLGTAYSIWTGIGAVGAFIVGIVLLGEHISVMRITAAVLIVSGIVLMKLSSTPV